MICFNLCDSSSTAVPDPPKSLAVIENTTESVTLSWVPPTPTESNPVSAQLVEMKREGKDYFEVAKLDAADSQYKALNLIQEERYYFRIRAQNPAGLSESAELAEPVTPKLPYGELV